jgi:hypothetical protein
MWSTVYRLDSAEGARYPVHIGGLYEQQCRSLIRVFAEEGITLEQSVQISGRGAVNLDIAGPVHDDPDVV